MASREFHASKAEEVTALAIKTPGAPPSTLMEAAKVEATLALAAAISEVAQNLFRIKRGY
jgi:phenylpyruvate tautomerase PptA (4-oxalocrotonate tautomerase family)